MTTHQESDNSSIPEKLLHPSEDTPISHQQSDEALSTPQDPQQDLPATKQDTTQDVLEESPQSLKQEIAEDHPPTKQEPEEDAPPIKQEEAEGDLSPVKQEANDSVPVPEQEADHRAPELKQAADGEDSPQPQQEPHELVVAKQANSGEEAPVQEVQPEYREYAASSSILKDDESIVSSTFEDDEEDKERTEPSLPRIKVVRVQAQPPPPLADPVTADDATIVSPSPVTTPPSLEDATIVSPQFVPSPPSLDEEATIRRPFSPSEPASTEAATKVQTQPLPPLADLDSEEATIAQHPLPLSPDEVTIRRPLSPASGEIASPLYDAVTVRQPPPPPAWYQEQFPAFPAAGPVSQPSMMPPHTTMPRVATVQRPVRGIAVLRKNRPLTIALIVLVLLLLGSGIYAFGIRDILPADSAVVQISPVSHSVSNQYTMTAVLGVVDSTSTTQISTHLITQSTAAKSMTVTATGRGHSDASYGHGMVSVRVVQGSFGNTNLHLTSNSGASIVIVLTGTLNVGDTGNFSAFSTNTGPGGNIPALDINGEYIENGTSNIAFVQNAAAFSGGQDARDFTTVQQSDIDSAAQQLQGQIPAAEASNAQTKAQQQLAFGEQFLNGVQCNPAVTSNHKAGEEAANVVVSVVVKCAGVAYDAINMQDKVTALLTEDANSQLGSGYIPTGHIVTTITSVAPFQEGVQQMTFQVSARGIWSFFFSFDQQKALALLIADKKQADASDLLAKQRGVASATIDTSGGLGTALPTSAQNIRIEIVPAKGL